MPGLWNGLKDYFLKGPRLSLHFMLTARSLACLFFAGRERRTVAGRAILPLPPAGLEPAFDPPNVKNPGEIGRLIREAIRQAQGSGHEASLLLPENCQKGFVLAFKDFPPATEEREELILWRLKKQIPSLPEDVRLSFDVAASGQPRRVFASLARAAVMREYEALFASGGIKLKRIGLPTLGLFNLIDRHREKDVVLVNVEEDSVSLLAVLDGQPALYRFKPFLTGKGLAVEELAIQVLKEVAGTQRFLEDREKKAAASLWIRSGAGPDPAELVEEIQAKTALAVRLLDAPVSTGLKPKERHFLAPLIGLAG